MQYSVIIPLFNEAQNLSSLYQELKQVMDSLGDTYQLIFINDGSTDQSLAILEKLQSQDRHIVSINFNQNQGQTPALKAGFERAQGEVIITLDADGQNDPQDIPVLLNRLKQGFDLVCGWRYRRKDTWVKITLSRLGNFFQRLLLQVPLHDISCTLKLMRRACLKELKLNYPSLHCFIPFFIAQKGYKISEVKVRHRLRQGGASKYHLCRQIFEVLRAFVYLYQNR